MTWSLLDAHGRRKYLTASERRSFVAAALAAADHVGLFCITLALTGARISEVLALSLDRIDASTGTIVFETLKRRRKGLFRAVPVPAELIRMLQSAYSAEDHRPNQRIWTFSRPTAWKHVKRRMMAIGVPSQVAKPKALRHAFGVAAVQQRITLSLVKKWLGHAKIETTAIYADPVGDEERALARLMWRSTPLGTDEGAKGAPDQMRVL